MPAPGRGADKGPREPRGPPSEATLLRRAQKKADKQLRKNATGFSRLFGGANAAAQEGGGSGAPAPAAAAADMQHRTQANTSNGVGAAESGARQHTPRNRVGSAAHRTEPDLGLGSDSESDDDDGEPEDDAEEPPVDGHSQQLFDAISRRLQAEHVRGGGSRGAEAPPNPRL